MAIMRICRDLGRCTVLDVLEEGLVAHRRDYPTILTFLGRLAAKGWLKVEKEGNTNCYSSAVNGYEALQRGIDRFFGDVVGSGPGWPELLRRSLGAKMR